MRVRLFGKTADDKGAQLEKLTQRLLERLGYRQIALNSIGSGGSEIDIRAEYPVPGLSGGNTIHLVGECKAFEGTVGLPDWLKFLGKLYTERILKQQSVRGVFVALSGVNGNVAGAYDALKNHNESVDLITGDNLVGQVLVEFKLPDVTQFLRRIEQMTNDTVVQTSLGYYGDRAFWIAEFFNETFTVLYGESLDQNPPSDLVEIISAQIQAGRYRNLSQEQLAKDRLALARKYILAQLLTGQSTDYPGQENFFPQGLPVTPTDLDNARGELIAEGKVISEAGAFKIAGIANDLGLRATIMRELVGGICFMSILASTDWDSLIDDELLAESLRIKDDLRIAESDRAALVILMKWSPRGLLWALSRDEMLCGHRGKSPELDALLAPMHAQYFRAQMLGFAIEDFRSREFGGILFERHGIRELRFTRHGTFKSQKSVELSMDVTERFAIAPCDPKLGGGLVHILLREDAPEPWSSQADIGQ